MGSHLAELDQNHAESDGRMERGQAVSATKAGSARSMQTAF